MSGHVAVVTDSTAYLPVGAAERLGVTVVPLHVVLGGQALAEGIEVDSARLAKALADDDTVTTSRPSPQAFVDVYREVGAAGPAGIVSLHLSGEISGTVDAARTAAREVAGDGIAVEVVDSRSLGMGLGFAVMTAAALAAAGAPAAQVAREAAHRAYETAIFLYVDTLEYLHRGGRIGAAQAWLGSALSVKPLLCMVDGRLEPMDRVRTTEKAIGRLVEAAVGEAGDTAVDVAVQHLAAADRADEVAARLREQIPGLRELIIGEVGAVVGAHVGPGMVAVAVSPLPSSEPAQEG
jgi:DegV family protein with EDD domain